MKVALRERAIDFMPPGQEQVAIVVDVSQLFLVPLVPREIRLDAAA